MLIFMFFFDTGKIRIQKMFKKSQLKIASKLPVSLRYVNSWDQSEARFQTLIPRVSIATLLFDVSTCDWRLIIRNDSDAEIKTTRKWMPSFMEQNCKKGMQIYVWTFCLSISNPDLASDANRRMRSKRHAAAKWSSKCCLNSWTCLTVYTRVRKVRDEIFLSKSNIANLRFET